MTRARTAALPIETATWYANFQSATEAYVVFAGQVFRYPRGDAAGRARAQAHGRLLGIPEPQLDWTV